MDILNEILTAVSVTLDVLFPGTPVYAEDIPQELPERYFILDYAGNPEIKLELGRRYIISGRLDIAYYIPLEQPDAHKELNAVFATLALQMQRCVSDLLSLRLETHQRNVVDFALHDICPFTCWLLCESGIPEIKDITINKEEVQ